MYGQERQVKVSVANKRIKKVKGQRNWSLIGNGILLITILVLLTIGLQMVVTYNQYYSSEGDSSDDDIYSYIYNDIVYDDAIYVHKDGDNSTGDNWEEAYITLNGAIFETSVDLDDKTIIFVGLGLFDVNVAGQLNITKNVHIVGSGRDGTMFTNSHTGADYILNVTRYFKIENCEIFINGTYSGIMVYGNNSDVRLIHMRFMAGSGAVDIPYMLHLLSGDHGEFEDIHIGGEGSIIIGIYLNGSNHNHFNDIEVFRCKGGITFDGVDTDENFFIDIRIFGAPKGLDIRSGNNQHFRDMFFEGCVMAVDDEVGDSYWIDIYTDEMLGAITPADLIGVDVDTNVAANIYGVDTIVFDATAIDSPFYITAVLFEPDAGERYGLRIWDAFSATYVYETVLEAKFTNQIDRHEIPVSMILNAHTIVYISIKSETGGDDMDIWLELIAIV